MPFSDPIVAGEELIRSAIKSENFSDGEDGNPATGWKISRNGDATFNSVDVRGNVEGDSGSFNNLSAQTSFIYRGDELEDLINAGGRGIITRAFLPTGSYSTTDGVGVGLLELGITMEEGRTYKIAWDELLVSSGSANCSMLAVLRYTIDGSQPNVSGGTGAELGVIERKSHSINGAESLAGSFIYQHLGPGSITFRVLLFMIPFGGTMNAGLRNCDMWIEDIGGVVLDTGVLRYGGVTPGKTLREFDTGFTAIRSYDTGGGYVTDQFAYQGKVPGVNSRRVGWNWFNIGSAGTPSIADMSGVPAGDLVYMDAYLYYPHWYQSAGGICVLGHHNVAAVPGIGAGEPAGGIVDERQETYTGRNQGRWFTLFGTAIGNAILAGTFRGFITGDHNINTSTTFYGYASDIRIRAGYYK